MNVPPRLTVSVSFCVLLGCQRAAEEPTPMKREAPPSATQVAPTAISPAVPTSSASSAPTTAKPLSACPADPDKGGPKVPTYTLSIPEAKVQLEAEFVWAPQDSERGLMYRTSMPENHGMLFKLSRKNQTFWMHNTCISLDMLFVEADGRIVGYLESVPTLNDEPRSIGIESVYVLEMNAGWCKAHGVKVGQHLVLPDAVKKLVVK